MGSRLAGCCRGARRRLWVSEGRSTATAERATAERLEAVPDLQSAVAEADIVISVCPPAEAEAVANAVSAVSGAAGTDAMGRDANLIYVDANAVSPATSKRIGGLFGRYVDGGIIGRPPRQPGTTRLYLAASAGDTDGVHPGDAAVVAALWEDSELETCVIDGGVGAASALKMAYAAWTKGSAALLTAIAAGAAVMGVEQDLRSEWALSQPELNDRMRSMPAGLGPKAWRFAGEMDEIAATFDDVGLPAGFWRAAADLYRRLGPLKEIDSPTFEELKALLQATTDE